MVVVGQQGAVGGGGGSAGCGGWWWRFSSVRWVVQAAALEQARGLAAHVAIRCEQTRLALIDRAGCYRRLFTWLLQA